MKILTWVVLVAVALGATAIAYRQQQTLGALRADVAQLGAKIDTLARREAAAATLPRAAGANGGVVTSSPAGAAAGVDAAEFAKLREEIAALRNQTKELGGVVKQAQAALANQQNPTANIPTNLTPVGSLKNAGKGSPELAMETLLWSATGGEVDALATTLTFTDTARARADAWFASLSESTRQQYGSPEKLIALMIAKDAASVTGTQVLGRKDITGDEVGMRVRFASDAGKTKDESFLLRRSTDGWRMVLPDQAVDRFAKQIGGK
jgi:hypothetical protein